MFDEKTMFFLTETSRGTGQLMSMYEFNDLVKQETGLFSMDLVLLTTCNDKFNGKFVLNCGAKHVVCINRNPKKEFTKMIQDFIENLYDNLANKKTVCDAFDTALKSIEM